MTIPSTYQRTVTGSGGTRVGGNAINVTQVANNPLTVAMSIKDRVVNGVSRVMTVKPSSGGASEVRAATSGGRLAYNPTASQWIAAFITNSLNGTANTTLKIPAADIGQNRKIVKAVQNQHGAKTMTAWREKAWVPTGIADQRSNWDASAASVGAGGVLSTLSGTTFKSTTNASNPANDKAVGDITIPGRLFYRDGSAEPITDTYSTFTGP